MTPSVASPDLTDSRLDAGQTASVILRPRLLKALDQAAANSLTLVIAPAGYGKTTLLTQWTQTRPAQILWCALSELDNDPAHLLQTLLQDIHTRFARPIPTFDPAGPLSYTLTQLFQYIPPPAATPWLLFLDDYHYINNPAIHQALDMMLERPVWPAHLVLVSRNLPPLGAIARLRVQGRLAELDETELRFTPDETQSFLAANGLALNEKEVQQITERIEGWPAALQLICQAAQQTPRPDLPTILERIGDDRPLFDYLAGQVLECQSEAIQDFLRRTALLPYLNAELCNTFLNITNASAILDKLEREHLFISPLCDRPGRCFRYHALFQDFMLRCLEQHEGVQAVENWHRRAAACLLEGQSTPPGPQQIDDHAAAIEHLLAARDWLTAAQSIEALVEKLNFGSISRLEPWFGRLSIDIMGSRVRLLVAQGRLRERQGRWDEALTLLTQAKEIAQATESTEDLELALRWLAWVNFRQDRYTEAIALAWQALGLLTGATETRIPEVMLSEQVVSHLSQGERPISAARAQNLAATYNTLANCYGNLGALEQAQQYHLLALQLFRRVGNREGEALVLHNMAAHYLTQGRLQKTLETERISLHILEELNSYRICFPLITMSQAHLQCRDFAAAQLTLERLLQLTDAYQDAPRRGYALLLSGHLQREQGRLDAADRYYEEAWVIAEQTHDRFLCFELHQGWARLALDRNDLHEARRQSHAALQRARQPLDQQLEGQALATLGRVLDIGDEGPQAEACYRQALPLVEAASGHLDQAQLHLSLADLCRRAGRDGEARQHLEQTLTLSMAYGYDFLFTHGEAARVIPLLMLMLGLPHDELQPARLAEICRLLMLIGPAAVAPLLALLATTRGQLERQQRIIELLGEIGDERATPALDDLRRDPQLQEIAQAALARIAAAPPPPLRIVALGGFQVTRGGIPIPAEAWQRRKTRQLLLYLLSRRAPVARDELLETLWPDLPPDSAALALNTTFSELRRILEPYLRKGQPSHYLARDEETLAFTAEVWYDVAAFRQAAWAGGQATRQALELYQNDFLPEEPYWDWALREREQLRSLYLNALMASLEEQLQAGAWREGVQLARRILEREAWLEEAWRALMTGLAQLGRRSEALHAYQECVRALRAELDVEPGSETRALYEQLKAM